MDPPGHTAQHGAALERQAIGRVVRIGQQKSVTVTRFEAEDTLEEDLYQMNSKAYANLDLQTSLSAGAGEYVCDILPGNAAVDSGGGGAAAAPVAPAGDDLLRAAIVDARTSKRQRKVQATAVEKEAAARASGGSSVSAAPSRASMAAEAAVVDAWVAAAVPATEDDVDAPPPPSLAPTGGGAGTAAAASAMDADGAENGALADVQEVAPSALRTHSPPPPLNRRNSAEGLAAQRAALQQRQHLQQQSSGRGKVADPAAVANLVGMGFSAADAAKALSACDGNLMRALDMILTGNLPVNLDA